MIAKPERSQQREHDERDDHDQQGLTGFRVLRHRNSRIKLLFWTHQKLLPWVSLPLSRGCACLPRGASQH